MKSGADEQNEVKQSIKRAKEYLSNRIETTDDDVEAIWSLAKELIKEDEFGWSRRLLDLLAAIHRYPTDFESSFIHKRALATYKDPDLNRKDALSRALTILQSEFELTTTKDQETLGLVGAIFKRKWEVDGNKTHLEHALGYYRRGFEEGIGRDGYTAINAAFVQDLLAFLEEKQAIKSGGFSTVTKERRLDAQFIRQSIVDALVPGLKVRSKSKLTTDDYWAVATVAEAYLGLNEANLASDWLAKAQQIPDISEWERESTARQLVHLIQVQSSSYLKGEPLEDSEVWKMLVEFLDYDEDALRTLFQGKLGVALSGGGFRASLYHIGVLAKMAELDILRHVEILSCVSGGSIIGAHYYLELRHLLKNSNKLEQKDYVKLIEKLVSNFKDGIQENPRVRILAKPWNNLKMIFDSSYSRTQRLGELYEEKIYSRVEDGEGDDKRWLNDLFIQPAGKQKQDFNLRGDNWKRSCKVPQLVLNATALNSGHNWQFTASWMGESPVSIDTDVDSNKRYRRFYYNDEGVPAEHTRIRLGTAVGASSCVPGLFEPVILKGLYPDTTIRLVDGGVYDNQGVANLLEQECNIIICSDAVGQMNTNDHPGSGIIPPLLRTNAIMMHRVRGAQYQDLKARQESSLLKGFAYMHLKQGLEGEQIDWIGCQEPHKYRADKRTHTPYGVRKDIQELLAGIRTDLDSFSDKESYALMTSGYLAAELALENLNMLAMNRDKKHDWDFLKVEAAMTCKDESDQNYRELRRQLKASPMTFFKVWSLFRPLRITAAIGAMAILAGLGYLWFMHYDLTFSASTWEWIKQLFTVGNVLTTLVLMLFATWLVNLGGRSARIALRVTRLRETLFRIIVGLGVGLIGWVGAFIHLHLFDRIFKYQGRVKK